MKITVDLPPEFFDRMTLTSNADKMREVGALVEFAEDRSCVIEFPERSEIGWEHEGRVVHVALAHPGNEHHRRHWSFISELVREES